MYEFPPSEIQWRWWLILLVLIVLSVLLRQRRERSPVVRVAWWMLVGSTALWILLGLPPIERTAEALRLAQCKNNVKWIGMAVHQYHDVYSRFPRPAAADGDGPPASWRVDLLPLFDPAFDPSLATEYDRSQAWDDRANLPIAQQQPWPYFCPTSGAPRDAAGRWHTAYVFLTGPGTPFPPDGPLRIGDITDGTSATLLLVEACGSHIVWTEPRDVDVSRQAMRINAPGEQPGTSNGVLSSYHPEGAHSLLVDGSVRFLSPATSEDVLHSLSTASAEDDPGDF